MISRYCLVCQCDRPGPGPTCGSWVCALALAYGWPEPLPVLPNVRPPVPPATGICGHCGGPMPRYGRDVDEWGRPVPRRYCSHRCSNRARVAGSSERRAARVEDVLDLLAGGQSPAAISARMGVKPGTLSILLSKAGHRDESCLFGREQRRENSRTRARLAW